MSEVVLGAQPKWMRNTVKQIWIKTLVAALLAGMLLAIAPVAGWAEAPIVIGEINSYSRFPVFTEPYRRGWELAMEEVNAAGGVLGRPLETIFRDDAGNPADALRAAQELVMRERVDLLAGSLLSNLGLAISEFAAKRQIVFIAAEPLTDALSWSQGNRYTFRLRPSTYMQAAMLAQEAARLPAVRWATVAPNYEYGISAVNNFKALLSALRPDVVFIEEQFPALGKLEAGPTVQALINANPDAIFNVTFAADLAEFVREGQTRGLFKNRSVVSMLTGEPEYLLPLGAEAPQGWIATGYPWYDYHTPAHDAFVQAYQQRWDENPYMGSLVGYVTLKVIAEAIQKAGSTDSEALIAALRGLEMDTPFGPILFRAGDHQATLGTFVGTTTVRNGQGVMVRWRYADGADYLPSEEEAAAMRPEGANR